MKTITLIILVAIFFCTTQNLQAQNPTLSAGLETLTMNKGTIDVEVLTQLIMEKQKELKQEALRRFILKLFPETNYTTKFYVQNCLNLLLNEKNPQVIEKEIYELTTNYALALGVAQFFSLTYNNNIVNETYRSYSSQGSLQAIKILDNYKLRKNSYALNYASTLKKLNEEIDTIINKIKVDSTKANYKKLAQSVQSKIDLTEKIIQEKIKLNQTETIQPNDNKLPFGIWLDISSAALSDIELLKKKGFFRKSIEFKSDEFYSRLIAGSEIDKRLAEIMQSLVDTVKTTINPYLENYAIIDAYYKTITKDNNKNKTKNIRDVIVTNIKNSITATVQKNITNLTSPEIAAKFSGVQEFLSKFNAQNERVSSADFIKNNLKNIQNLKSEKDNLTSLTKVAKGELDEFIEEIKKYKDTLIIDTSSYVITTRENLQINNLDLLNKSANELFNAYKDAKKIADTTNHSNFKEILKSINLSLKTLSIDTIKVTNLEQADSIPFDKLKSEYEKKRSVSVAKIDTLLNNFAESPEFYKALLSKIAIDLTGDKLLPETLKISLQNKEILAQYTSLIASTYKRVNKLIDADKIGVEDVEFFEEEIIPEFIRLGSALSINKSLNQQITTFYTLSKLLKIQAVLSLPQDFEYKDELKNVLKFVADLGKLDKAESYQDMLILFEDANNLVIKNLKDQEFRKTYTLFSNALKKYTLIYTEKQAIEIDIASFLNELQQYYGKNNNSWIGLYLTLGLNQNFFFRDVHLPGDSTTINNIGFASEKLGLKFRFNRVRRINGLENAVLTDVNLDTNAPFINEWYGILYGSGLLYSIANSSTNSNFDYPHIGVGTGLRFYNALDVNFVVGFPFIKNHSPFKNAFYGLSFDIPLGEYLEKLGSKKK